MINVEINIIKHLQSLSNNLLDALFKLITSMGEGFIIIFVIVFLYYGYSKKVAEKIAFSIFGSVLLNNALKGIFYRPRPFQKYPNDVKGIYTKTATGTSFPSGHSQNSATFYTILGLEVQKKWFWILMNILIFLVALSRLYLGVHYPSDVLVGVSLGIGVAWLSTYLYDKFSQDIKQKAFLFATQILIFTPFLFFPEKLNLFIKTGKDFYIIYVINIAFSLGVIIENHFVDFDNDIEPKIKIYRILIALLVTLFTYIGLKYLFNLIAEESMLLDLLRYFLVAFIPTGALPFLFKSTNKIKE